MYIYLYVLHLCILFFSLNAKFCSRTFMYVCTITTLVSFESVNSILPKNWNNAEGCII